MPHTNTIIILRVNKIIASVLILEVTTFLEWRTDIIYLDTWLVCLSKASIESTIWCGCCQAWCKLNLYNLGYFCAITIGYRPLASRSSTLRIGSERFATREIICTHLILPIATIIVNGYASLFWFVIWALALSLSSYTYN